MLILPVKILRRLRTDRRGWRAVPFVLNRCRPAVVAAFAAIVLLMAGPAGAQDPAAFFKQNCTSCHTIGGGRLTGPDLKDVTQRKERAWLTRFVQDPKAMLDSGDPYAAKLLQEARGAVMAKVVGIDESTAVQLLDLIEAESKLPKSRFVGAQISDRPFSALDFAAGRQIFLGERRLKANGPACLSCHSVAGLPNLGGGRLAPDLTRVFERLGGRKGLSTWLTAPPTVTMAPVFKNHPLESEEILPLVAFFQDAAQKGGVADTSTWMFNFLLLALGATVVALILFDLIWIRRFRAVRRPLILGFDTTKGQK
jgi:mono/diheme cytochrome c family protein